MTRHVGGYVRPEKFTGGRKRQYREMDAFVYVVMSMTLFRTDSNSRWMIYNFVPERGTRILE